MPSSRTVATSELVVPRSMPIARRRGRFAGASSGSEICSNAILSGHLPQHLVEIAGQLVEELELAHARPGRGGRGLRLEELAERRLHRLRIAAHFPQQRV